MRTVEYIAENPYMQYFLGLSKFQQEPLFDPSMMTHFRKRFGAEMIDELWESTDRSGHKTAYNRKKARAKYLAMAKQRKPRKNKIKQAVREQLEYVRKNLETIDRLIAESGKPMIPKRLSRLDTIREVAKQQQEMQESRSHYTIFI